MSAAITLWIKKKKTKRERKTFFSIQELLSNVTKKSHTSEPMSKTLTYIFIISLGSYQHKGKHQLSFMFECH